MCAAPMELRGRLTLPHYKRNSEIAMRTYFDCYAEKIVGFNSEAHRDVTVYAILFFS